MLWFEHERVARPASMVGRAPSSEAHRITPPETSIKANPVQKQRILHQKVAKLADDNRNANGRHYRCGGARLTIDDFRSKAE